MARLNPSRINCLKTKKTQKHSQTTTNQHAPTSAQIGSFLIAPYSKAAWPMAAVIALIEIGTRLTVDVFVGPYKTSEQSAAIRLTRSLTIGMLLLWDRAFVGYELWNEVVKTGAHLLGRLKSNMIFEAIKTHMVDKTPTLRSKTPLGCLQEIYGLLIAHMAVRILMAEAASKWDLDPDRLSFTGALRVLSRAIPRMQAAKTALLPIFYDSMLDEIASHLNPPRINRINPRVVKRKMSNFGCKCPEHFKIKQPKIPFREAIYVLN